VPYDHKDVITAQAKELAADRAQALVDYERANSFDDGAGVMAAADRIIEIDAKTTALNGIARNLVMQQAAPRGNRFGLTQDELDIAKSCRQTDEEYARNKDRLQYLRATGQYRDDQGTVRR
jgi:hypothetical protein